MSTEGAPVTRTCAECGQEFEQRRRGRPSVYCRPACRQRAWALRQARATLDDDTSLPSPSEPRPAPPTAPELEPSELEPSKPPEPEPEPSELERPEPPKPPEPEPESPKPSNALEPEPPDLRTVPPPSDVETTLPAASPASPSVPPRAGPVQPAPTDVRGWVTLLKRLSAQLDDPNSDVAKRPWEHARLYDSLGQALTALDAATPGGLAWLERND